MKKLAIVLITASNLCAMEEDKESWWNPLTWFMKRTTDQKPSPEEPPFEVLEPEENSTENETTTQFQILDEYHNQTQNAIVPYGFGKSLFEKEEKTENTISVSFCEKVLLLRLGNREDIVSYVTSTNYPWFDLRYLHLDDSMLPFYPNPIIEKKKDIEQINNLLKNLLSLKNEPENHPQKTEPKQITFGDLIDKIIEKHGGVFTEPYLTINQKYFKNPIQSINDKEEFVRKLLLGVTEEHKDNVKKITDNFLKNEN